MPLKEADKSYDFKKIEEKVQNFWADNDIYDKTNTLRAEGPQYSFLDGPPYCSGKIHLGTTWNKVIKDQWKNPPGNHMEQGNQGYIASLQIHERIQLEKAGRMGYSWIAYRAQG